MDLLIADGCSLPRKSLKYPCDPVILVLPEVWWLPLSKVRLSRDISMRFEDDKRTLVSNLLVRVKKCVA